MSALSINKEGALPGFATAKEALGNVISTLDPPVRKSVVEATEESRNLALPNYTGRFTYDVAPYMREPSNTTTSRLFTGCVFVGPARTLKTCAMIENPLVHAITCDPRNAILYHTTRDSCKKFSEEAFDPMISLSDDMQARLIKDTLYRKKFQGGMSLWIDPPTENSTASFSYPLVLCTDFDRHSGSVGDEGDLWSVIEKRSQSYRSYGMCIAESSPGKPILVEDWKRPENQPHLAPPCNGILSVYNKGSLGRYYWGCPDCHEPFEPTFQRFVFDKTGSNEERAASVAISCPSCGSLIEERHKEEMNSKGHYLHQCEGGKLVRLEELKRPVKIASWWVFGPVAAFQTWPEITKKYLDAVEDYRLLGNEETLKTVTNVDIGDCFLPRALKGKSALTVDVLREKQGNYSFGTAPKNARMILISVDVQPRRFVVQVEFYGVDLECGLVDRFDIDIVKDEERAIDPASYPEDWDILFDLLDREYRVQGTDYALKPLTLVVDSGGEDGATENAYNFYRNALKRGFENQVRILKGRKRLPNGLLAQEKAIENTNSKKMRAATDIVLLWVSTDAIKDAVNASLTRKKQGPSYYHLPIATPDNIIEEFCAERRTEKGWFIKAGVKRNEAFDLAGYNRAVAIRLELDQVNWDNPPEWAALVESNSMAVLVNGQQPEEAYEENSSYIDHKNNDWLDVGGNYW